MRIPVFSHQANPQVDRPLLRKKLAYVEDLVSSGQGDLVDPSNPFAGVMLRARVLLKRDGFEESLSKVAGSGFDSAWHLKQSGWAGPIVWQLKTSAQSMAS